MTGSLFHRRESFSSTDYSDDGSDHSRSTAPTDYSVRPCLKHYETDPTTYLILEKWDDSFYVSPDARSSVDTYASTTLSELDFDKEDAVYEEPDYIYEQETATAIPSTPSEFAEHFPSKRRMCIRHDNTVDGNMNLRVDTEASDAVGKRVELTLFHLRMHDLKSRDFSFRRYCRESGREVCHSSRKYTKPASDKRPGFQRSMSNALASLRSKSDNRMATVSSLKRSDSGYDSMSDDGDSTKPGKFSFKEAKGSSLPIPTNTTKLEFSNYAHIDLKRRGTRSSKRYEFEYWGGAYAWKRVAKKVGKSKEISYHLYNTETLVSVAHILPIPMTPAEADDEERKGGWVPPCSMWISDEKVSSGSTDVAE